jgi:hypothetical protein
MLPRVAAGADAAEAAEDAREVVLLRAAGVVDAL